MMIHFYLVINGKKYPVELKCPWILRDKDDGGISIEEAAEKSTFCLERLDDGSFTLKRNHKWFFQVKCSILC